MTGDREPRARRSSVAAPTRLVADLAVARPEFEVAVRLDLPPGEPVALVGPNGAGKSTVLAALAGHVPLSRGGIRLLAEGRDGRDLTGLPPERRGVGVVFQQHLLFRHLTVRDNVAFPFRVRGRGRGAAREAAAPWLERFGLADLADRHPDALSGGQAQRVALARTLVAEPDVLLLDEPWAALDVEVRDAVRDDLIRHAREFGGPVLVVSHDPDDLVALGGRVVVLERGAVTQAGSWAELAAAPATGYVARLTRGAGGGRPVSGGERPAP